MVQCVGGEFWETVTGLNWLEMIQCVGAECLEGVSGRNWLLMVHVFVRNVERVLLGLTGSKCYMCWCGILRDCHWT